MSPIKHPFQRRDGGGLGAVVGAVITSTRPRDWRAR